MVKVQKSGNCYSVYLPNEWVNTNKLDKGSDLELQASRENLILTAQGQEKPVKKSTLTLSTNKPELITKFIKAAYITGYDELEVITSQLSDESVNKVAQLIKNLGLNMIKVSKYGFHIKSSTSIDDLPLFTWEFIYKIINIIRMSVTSEKEQMIKEQIKSIYYNRLIIQRTVYRYQQLLTKQRIKPFESNTYTVIAVNLDKVVRCVSKIKDKKYLNKLLAFTERLLKVFNYTELKPLCDIIQEVNELRTDGKNALKNKIYNLMSGIINALTEYYMAENT